jgi:hypothetical protein
MSSSDTFKGLMNEMAELFPQLPEKYQNQAREAHSHVQFLMKEGENDQAIALMTHMRDLMKSLAKKPSDLPHIPPTVEEETVERRDDAAPSIPPLPPSSSPELVAVQRTLEELEMKMKGNDSIKLIAKRVRDIDMEQKYFQLEERLRVLKDNVNSRLSSIGALSDSAAVLARREAKKRTVSKNPFCDHEASGFCEFCVGREIEEEHIVPHKILHASAPPISSGSLREDAVTNEMVMQMQQTLKSYQSTLKELLDQRMQELNQQRVAENIK